MRDFSGQLYDEFIRRVKDSAYKPMTVAEYFESHKNDDLENNLLVLRHDLCRKAEISTEEFAEIEYNHGIRSTFYFRNPESYDLDIIKKVSDMGHEIGVHYDSLDKARGDYAKARDILLEDLRILRKIAPVKTIAMHGNPSTKWDNRDLFQKYDLKKEFDLLAEGYLSFDFTRVMYYSDTGRTWLDGKYNSKDIIPDDMATVSKPEFAKTSELFELLKSDKRNLYLLIHPNRWRYDTVGWWFKYISDQGKNQAKQLFNIIYKRN